MPSDFHIKFDGLSGESAHKDHKDEITIVNWKWDVQQAKSDSVGGSGLGRAQPGDFMFSHNYDKASPMLAKQCAAGKHFADAVLTARKPGDGQKDFLKVTMKEVFITRVAPETTPDGRILEDVFLSYKDIEFSYKPQDDKGGLGGEVKFGWNVPECSTR